MAAPAATPVPTPARTGSAPRAAPAAGPGTRTATAVTAAAIPSRLGPVRPAAVAATRENASANHVRLEAGEPASVTGRYALIVANILASPLKLLAPLLATHLEAGASLVLSGILERQADELREAYAPWLTLGVDAVDDGWILMTGVGKA